MGIEIKNLGFGFALIIDNKNTQRRFKINIKELTQDTSGNFLKRFFRGFNGVKGGALFQYPPMRFKKSLYHKIKINYKKLKNKFLKKNIEKAIHI